MNPSIPNQIGLNNEDFKRIFQTMWEIRLFDEAVERLFAAGKIHGTTHLSIGQEATAAASGYLLRKTDWITSTHRGHGHTIAKQTDMNGMMAELFGKENGTNHGKGGSMHIADLNTGNLGSNGIVGAGFPIAVGAALSAQMKHEDRVTLCYAGDGSTNEGSFHEALNLASIWSLPVIFFIENNHYGMSSSIKEMVNIPQLSERATAYGFEGVTIDGNDILAVLNATHHAIEKAKRGEGPTLIEAITYRFKGHSKSDNRVYRSEAEEKEWIEKKDPLILTQKMLLEHQVLTSETAAQIQQQAKEKVEAAIAYAEAGAMPKQDALYTNVYAKEEKRDSDD